MKQKSRMSSKIKQRSTEKLNYLITMMVKLRKEILPK